MLCLLPNQMYPKLLNLLDINVFYETKKRNNYGNHKKEGGGEYK